MRTDFRRIAIVNRAEPALRLIHAVRAFNRERGAVLETVAFYPTTDRGALYVREADAAIELVDGMASDDEPARRRVAYLDLARIEQALLEAEADAAWAGWGFLSERADFVDLCDRLGVAFIGPSAETMRRVGNKVACKELARHLGIPVVPWGHGAADSLEHALSDGRSLGYPVVLKAVAGSGGRAIQKVESEARLREVFDRVRDEARRLFDDPGVFVERWLSGARHIEVQFAADSHGTAWAIGTRDCTVQRRHQKVFEEAPAPGLTPGQDALLREDTLKLCRAAGYRNVGTVEFLLDPATGQHYLMEVNPRQQVEHPVTEMTTGIDLVKLQLHLARGGRLEGQPPTSSGHAVEVRFNAEAPDAGFAPAPGVVTRLRVPPRAGLRLDAGVGEGDVIPPEYDSMFAKLVAHGRTRLDALEVLSAGLADASVVVDGGMSNRSFLLNLTGQEDLLRSAVDVEWLDRLAASGQHVSFRDADVAIIQAAIEACDEVFEVERDDFLASAARQRPVVRTEVGRTFELRHRGHTYVATVLRQGPLHYRVQVDGTRIDAVLERTGPTERLLAYGGRRYRTQSFTQGLTHVVEIGSSLHRVSRDEAGILRALSPSVVVSVKAKPGDRVGAGDTLVVLEAMKMETPVLAPTAGTVRDVWILPNTQVGSGAALLRMDQDAPAEPAMAAVPRVTFAGNQPAAARTSGRWRSRVHAFKAGLKAFADALAPPDVERARNIVGDLHELFLGSDIPSADVKQLLDEYRTLADRLPAEDPILLRLEDAILQTYSDVSTLFGRQGMDEDPNDPTRLSAGQYFLTYLRTLEARGAGLPERFVSRLRRTLEHFGSDSLEVTVELKNRLFWLYRSHLREAEQSAVVQAVLERRARHAPALATSATPEFEALLEQIATLSEASSPALADIAHDVKYRFFVQPVFEQGRQAVYEEIEAHLAHLRRDPTSPDREARLRVLVDCPQPLGRFLTGRFEDAAPALRDIMLEVLTRRFYRIRSFNWLELGRLDGRSVLAAEYHLGEELFRLVVTHARKEDLVSCLQSLRDTLANAPADRRLLLDVYVSDPWASGDADGTSRDLLAALDEAALPRRPDRVVFVVAGAGAEWAGSATPHFTFRLQDGAQFVEDTLVRGLHPMMGERLEVSRLRHFKITRQPSAEDVYLFHAVAHDNPRDQRLFAFGEVRDLTVVRDAEGSVVQIPHLERLVLEIFTAMREFQLRRPPDDRLVWNRIVLSIAEPFALSRRELVDIGRRLAPLGEGLDLEKLTLVGPMPDPDNGQVRRLAVNISNPSGRGLRVRYLEPHDRPIQPLTEYESKVVRMRQRGLTYPYEVVRLLTPDPSHAAADLPAGEFIEHDLDEAGVLVPVARPYGRNAANIVVGLIRSLTPEYPEGMTRVILLGDPSREMGSLAEPECRRILAALDLATRMKVPLEWFALSAGAKISKQSGTENMDWIAIVLRRIVEFTQAGGEINIVVTGINVGAQPYWNAEATMLMHTRGILVMMPESAMVLTGKTALDYSGSVSAEDNTGIGGYERVMGPNGQAQYWAHDLNSACHILLRHYGHTYLVPGERFPRRAQTSDLTTRDVCTYAHGRVGPAEFALVGDALSPETNPGRKKAFDIRRIMHAVRDQDHEPLERWTGMLDAEISVVWDARIGGYPVCLLGFESRPLARLGFVPTDGPDHWTSGTLFPMSSKKTARAINAATGNRPLVVLANLSGFDGSPESMRRRQLEFGAEIGRAVVNFDGPIVFCVVSRYHGGAFVVFSKVLNDNMEVVALEGTYASVIGGAPAAAVVFAREVDQRTKKDPRVAELEQQMATADDATKRRLRSSLAAVFRAVRSEKLGEVADEFDHIHSVQRALQVGSLDRIIPPHELRPYLVDAIERGMARAMKR